MLITSNYLQNKQTIQMEKHFQWNIFISRNSILETENKNKIQFLQNNKNDLTALFLL